jgi:hypothetical protein
MGDDQDKSDQDSDGQDGSEDDNAAPLSSNGNEGASNPPIRASISGSSKVHWTQQEDELLREGESPLRSDLSPSFLIPYSGQWCDCTAPSGPPSSLAKRSLSASVGAPDSI